MPFCNRCCAIPVDVKIIVTDAPPLITLAAAQSLDYLLYPQLPVIIPDAVFFEATRAADKLGAQEILDPPGQAHSRFGSLRGAKRRSNLDCPRTVSPRLLRCARNDGSIAGSRQSHRERVGCPAGGEQIGLEREAQRWIFF